MFKGTAKTHQIHGGNWGIGTKHAHPQAAAQLAIPSRVGKVPMWETYVDLEVFDRCPSCYKVCFTFTQHPWSRVAVRYKSPVDLASTYVRSLTQILWTKTKYNEMMIMMYKQLQTLSYLIQVSHHRLHGALTPSNATSPSTFPTFFLSDIERYSILNVDLARKFKTLSA